MTDATITLSAAELRGLRAAVLEAVTDQIFDVQPELRARADALLSELFASSGASVAALVPQMDRASLEVLTRSMAHVDRSIEPWELSLRIGLTRDELNCLITRVAAPKNNVR